MRRLLALVLVLVLVFAACAPPPDVPKDGRPVTDPQQSQDSDPSDVSTDGANDPVSPSGNTGGGPVNETTRQPRPSKGPRDGDYTKLAGGVYTLRCPACAETQPPGSTKCAGCKQELVPRGKQVRCTLCGGEGRCHHCGDDRDCFACGAAGDCAYCDGTGVVAEEKCGECTGSKNCRLCAGDGRRESVQNEFDALETALPGICPTCLDGSGLCPECGANGANSQDEPCLSCGGERVCWDCAGLGTCPYDGADGLCVACGGSGVEVFDRAPLPPYRRTWAMRTATGMILEGRPTGRPDPNLTVKIGNQRPIAKTREELHPLTYFQAFRDHTEPGDAKAWILLATYAEDDYFWPLAAWAYRRAIAADPAVRDQANKSLRLAESRRTSAWLAEAEKALAAEDRERAKRLFTLVRSEAPGTPLATQSRTQLFAIAKREEIERKGMDQETRERIADETKMRIERVLRAVDLRLSTAKRLLHRARSESLPDAAIERLYDRAAWMARDAQRLLLVTAHRHPPSVAPWARPPAALLSTIRKQRASVLQERAVHSVAGGRFEFAARLADRAARLDPGNSLIEQTRKEATRGVLRRGVHLGTPPVDQEKR